MPETELLCGWVNEA